jgi:hypothetical protein
MANLFGKHCPAPNTRNDARNGVKSQTSYPDEDQDRQACQMRRGRTILSGAECCPLATKKRTAGSPHTLTHFI